MCSIRLVRHLTSPKNPFITIKIKSEAISADWIPIALRRLIDRIDCTCKSYGTSYQLCPGPVDCLIKPDDNRILGPLEARHPLYLDKSAIYPISVQ